MENIRAIQPNRRKRNQKVGLYKYVYKLKMWWRKQEYQQRKKFRVLFYVAATAALFFVDNYKMGFIYLGLIVLFSNQINRK